MVHSRSARRSAALLGGAACVTTVARYGELSLQALLAVTATGVLLATIAIVRRSGEGAAPVGRRGLPWVPWLGAALAWELHTLGDQDLLTLSDLMDPVLAHPVPRGAATVGWLAVGAWLLARPARRDGPP